MLFRSMLLLFFFFFFGTVDASLQKGMLGQRISHYEVVECRVSRPRTRRTPQDGSLDVEVRFRTSQSDFRLLLWEDGQFRDVPEVSGVYEGVVASPYPSSYGSYALGFLQDGRAFNGYVQVGGGELFVESASRFFPELSDSSKVVVYRREDVVDAATSSRTASSGATELNVSQLERTFRENAQSRLESLLPEGLNRSSADGDHRACGIEMVADDTLYHYFKGNVPLLEAYLYLHAKFADYVFRATDLDGVRVRIVPERISVYRDSNHPMARARDMDQFLHLFSYRVQGHCLSVCLTFRHPADRIVGEAYKAGPRPTDPPGGICQRPLRLGGSLWPGPLRSLNTAVVTVRDRAAGDLTPLAVSLRAVVHELGHGFGADHDRMGDLRCSPGGARGFYVMHGQARREVRPLSASFSPCSARAMARTVAARGGCLRALAPRCGNGVCEAGEACDCGPTRAACRYLDRCCAPGCKLRRGAACSPKEAECCRADCAVLRDTKMVCYDSDDERCLLSRCDGANATCPAPAPAPDGHPCRSRREGARSCRDGACNSSVCLDHNLRDCACARPADQCYVCCRAREGREGGSCKQAIRLGLPRRLQPEGTPCNRGRHQCDGSGSCVDPNSRREASETGVPAPVLIGALGVLAVMLAAAVGFLVHAVKGRRVRLC